MIKSNFWIFIEGENSRAFVASLNGVSTAAQACAFAQSKAVGEKIKSKQVQPEDAAQAILDACPQYKTELEPTFNAYKAAIPEMNNAQSQLYNDFPASFQTMVQHYGDFAKEVQSNPDLPKDKATFGAKVKALVDEFKAISEEDRAALGQKLPYLNEIFLSSGQYFNDFNMILDDMVAQASGQEYDKETLKQKGKQLEKYLVQHLHEYFDYINEKIDNYVIPQEVAQDGNVNKIAAAYGKTGANYAKMFLKNPQFNSVLNSIVTGKIVDAPAAPLAVESA